MSEVMGRIVETNNYIWLTMPSGYGVIGVYYYNTETGAVIRKGSPHAPAPNLAEEVVGHYPKRMYPILDDIPVLPPPDLQKDILHFNVEMVEYWDDNLIKTASEFGIDLTKSEYTPSLAYHYNPERRRVLHGAYVYREVVKKRRPRKPVQ